MLRGYYHTIRLTIAGHGCIVAQKSRSRAWGEEIYLAQQKTDAQGKYTLLLQNPGTYYIVESRTLGDRHQQYAGNRSTTGWYMGPITVNTGDKIVLEDMRVPPAF